MKNNKKHLIHWLTLAVLGISVSACVSTQPAPIKTVNKVTLMTAYLTNDYVAYHCNEIIIADFDALTLKKMRRYRRKSYNTDEGGAIPAQRLDKLRRMVIESDYLNAQPIKDVSNKRCATSTLTITTNAGSRTFTNKCRDKLFPKRIKAIAEELHAHFPPPPPPSLPK